DDVEIRQTALKSVVERNDIDEFLVNSELARKNFEAHKDKVRIVGATEMYIQPFLGSSFITHRDSDNINYMNNSLSIPKRPAWTIRMTADEINTSEGAAFLDWRRSLSKLETEAKCKITPYEKNLDIWRQLWRVILDARNPLAFRCPDLESYIMNADAGYKDNFEPKRLQQKQKGDSIEEEEEDDDDEDSDINQKQDISTQNPRRVPLRREERKFILLLNKADLLTEEQRFD
ncbi:MAG: putative large subunit GTPase 1, partial [Streblomastix strix]